MSPGELAAHERVQPPSMTRVVVGARGHGAGHADAAPHRRPPGHHRAHRRPRWTCSTAEGRAREAWLSGRLHELTPEEREMLRDAAEIMDKLASG